jgi:hypothetical protein
MAESTGSMWSVCVNKMADMTPAMYFTLATILGHLTGPVREMFVTRVISTTDEYMQALHFDTLLAIWVKRVLPLVQPLAREMGVGISFDDNGCTRCESEDRPNAYPLLAVNDHGDHVPFEAIFKYQSAIIHLLFPDVSTHDTLSHSQLVKFAFFDQLFQMVLYLAYLEQADTPTECHEKFHNLLVCAIQQPCTWIKAAPLEMVQLELVTTTTLDGAVACACELVSILSKLAPILDEMMGVLRDVYLVVCFFLGDEDGGIKCIDDEGQTAVLSLTCADPAHLFSHGFYDIFRLCPQHAQVYLDRLMKAIHDS